MSPLLLLLLTLLGGLLSLFLLVLGWILQALAGKEAEAAIQALTADLLRRAERRLPAGQRARFAEETRAGLLRFSERRPLWALLQAVSLYVAAVSRRLVDEFETAEELDQPRAGEVGKAFAHPLRVRILILLNESPADEVELANQLEQSLNVVAYHLLALIKLGVVEVASQEQARGAVRSRYRAVRRQYFSDSEWTRFMGQPGLEPGTDGL